MRYKYKIKCPSERLCMDRGFPPPIGIPATCRLRCSYKVVEKCPKRKEATETSNRRSLRWLFKSRGKSYCQDYLRKRREEALRPLRPDFVVYFPGKGQEPQLEILEKNNG